MNWDNNISMTDIHSMKDRLVEKLKELAHRAARDGDLNGYAAFLRSAEFIMAEPLYRCYSVSDVNTATAAASSESVSESEQEVDIIGVPA
jgi:hypothetical protein